VSNADKNFGMERKPCPHRYFRVFSVFAPLLAAASVTFALCLLDLSRARDRQITSAETEATEAVAELKALAWESKIAGHKDPLGWAVKVLSQSRGAHRLVVAPLSSRTPASDWGGDRVSTVNWDESRFVLEQILFPETQSGVKVSVPLESLWLLGSGSRLEQDIKILLVLGLFWFVAYSLWKRSSSVQSHSTPSATRPPQSVSWDGFTDWQNRFHFLMRALGQAFAEQNRTTKVVVRDGETLHSHLVGLQANQGNAQAQVTAIRGSHLSIHTQVETLEKLVLNIVLESNRIQGGAALAQSAERLHAALKPIQKEVIRASESSHLLHAEVEEWELGSARAFAEFSQFFDHQKASDLAIQNTRSHLIEQAKAFENFKSVLRQAQSQGSGEQQSQRAEQSDRPDRALG
jgi:hypothetical protein